MQPCRRKFIFTSAACAGNFLLDYGGVAADNIKKCNEVVGLARCNNSNGISCLGELLFGIESDDGADKPLQIRVPKRLRKIVAQSGYTGFDDALKADVLDRLNGLFGINPKFSYFDESFTDESPGAFASSSPRAEILFGVQLLGRMLERPGGDYAALAICAHEYGHLLQDKMSIKEKIANQLPCYAIELHADLLAGYFVGVFKDRYPSADLQRIGSVWELWRPFSCTHGSQEHRLAAIQSGYELSQVNPGATVEQVSELGINQCRSTKKLNDMNRL